MSLPGLQLSAPVEATVVPTIHDLKEGSEWRFEVAFGAAIEVRVSSLSTEESLIEHPLLTYYFQATLRQC